MNLNVCPGCGLDVVDVIIFCMFIAFLMMMHHKSKLLTVCITAIVYDQLMR